MKSKLIFIPTILLFLLSLSLWTLQYRAGDELIKQYGLSDLSLQEKIAFLENSVDDREKVTAGITATKLFITIEGKEFQYRLPQEAFYLSIAPYIDQTHPCGIHSFVTCQGELVNQTFDVEVLDESNTIILEGSYSTYSNGFFGIWLPKNSLFRLTVTYRGMRASSLVATSLTSNTCLTTLRLT